ncbi:hypothetical protein EC973_005055 [Apophysomyces ossiformis]|uniref:F-box domain-containing protein n=1 Tax=Apophysomyces ossiformis TaxID=679940 RepID=A0A8H7ESZ8_9FUNG|nr:hypothetical protein EC973_005055 [Apophysomyces ossiformis]
MSFDPPAVHNTKEQQTNDNQLTDNYYFETQQDQYGSTDTDPQPIDKGQHSYSRKGRKNRYAEVDPSAPCYIQQLSIELITHIFARLDPETLGTAAKVCRYWRHIVTDDSCWKHAFKAYFGALPFKRLLSDSWKSEYILRTHLLRKLEKGRGTVLSFNPKLGSIDDVFVDFENSWMMVSSTDQGVAVRCNPATGKVDRHLLFSTDEGIPLHLTAVKMDRYLTHDDWIGNTDEKCFSAYDRDRILWGFGPGFITMTMRAKSIGDRRQLKVFTDFHLSAVKCLALPSFSQEVVVSGSEDGEIKIWDVVSKSCALNLFGAAPGPTCIDVTKSHVIAGYANGTVVVWNVHAKTVIAQHRERVEHPGEASHVEVPIRRYIHPPSADVHTPVQSIKYDENTGMIIVSYQGLKELWKYELATGHCITVFGYGHELGVVSCVEWDTDLPSMTSTLKAALKPKAQKTGPMTRRQISEASTPTTDTDMVNSVKTTRLLVSGDTAGTICVWDGDAVSHEGRRVRPLRIFHGHLAPISALWIDAAKIVSGSDDGWIRIWDPLTGYNIKTLANKIPRRAPIDRNDVSLMRVKNIRCNNYQGVATIGHEVKTWDFSPDKQLLARRNLRPKSKAVSTGARGHLHHEIKQELRESREKLEQEKKEKELHEKKLKNLTLSGLSEEEMIAYAVMLSQEESTAASSSGNESSSASSQQSSDTNDFASEDFMNSDDEDLMKAVIASLEVTAAEETQECLSLDTEKLSITDHSEWPTAADVNGGITRNENDRSSFDCLHNNPWTDAKKRVIEPLKAEPQQKFVGRAIHYEAYDEELEYVLRLSRGEF